MLSGMGWDLILPIAKTEGTAALPILQAAIFKRPLQLAFFMKTLFASFLRSERKDAEEKDNRPYLLALRLRLGGSNAAH